jgi:ribonuclease HI
MKLIINTDGCSKNNPGPAAIGVVLRDITFKKVATISQALGEATNNEAEYKAVIAGLEKALKMGATQVEIRSDSELMVNQLNGRYKVKSAGLRPLYLEATQLLSKLTQAKISYIPRELNSEADALANEALKKKH